MEAPKDGIKVERPEGKLRSNGSIMADDGDNVVWYIGPDGKQYEHRVKSDTWYLVEF